MRQPRSVRWRRGYGSGYRYGLWSTSTAQPNKWCGCYFSSGVCHKLTSDYPVAHGFWWNPNHRVLPVYHLCFANCSPNHAISHGYVNIYCWSSAMRMGRIIPIHDDLRLPSGGCPVYAFSHRHQYFNCRYPAVCL